MAKKLNLQPQEDFILFGLVSSEKDYKLCYDLNRWLNLGFNKTDDLEIIPIKQDAASAHSMFAYLNENDGWEMFLIGNKGSAYILIPEHRNLDYFLVIKGNYLETDKDELAINLKNLPSILGVFELNPAKLKSKENLLFT